jgi:hypothetical protein
MNPAVIRWLMAGPDNRGRGRLEAFVIPNGGRYSRWELCDGCAVRQECLDAALADDSLVGLWGGNDGRPAAGDAAAGGVARATTCNGDMGSGVLTTCRYVSSRTRLDQRVNRLHLVAAVDQGRVNRLCAQGSSDSSRSSSPARVVRDSSGSAGRRRSPSMVAGGLCS